MNRSTTSIMILGAIAVAVASLGCGDKSSNEARATDALGGSALASATSGTDLSGTWKLNKEQSDAPPEQPRSERTRGMREHSPEGEHPRGERSGEFVMTIAQTDSTVSITGPRGQTRRLFTDGRAMKPQSEREPEDAEVRASWNSEGQLVIEHTGPRGAKHTETFSLSADGSQMYVVSVMQRPNDDESRTLRRVFDAVSSGS